MGNRVFGQIVGVLLLGVLVLSMVVNLPLFVHAESMSTPTNTTNIYGKYTNLKLVMYSDGSFKPIIRSNDCGDTECCQAQININGVFKDDGKFTVTGKIFGENTGYEYSDWGNRTLILKASISKENSVYMGSLTLNYVDSGGSAILNIQKAMIRENPDTYDIYVKGFIESTGEYSEEIDSLIAAISMYSQLLEGMNITVREFNFTGGNGNYVLVADITIPKNITSNGIPVTDIEDINQVYVYPPGANNTIDISLAVVNLEITKDEFSLNFTVKGEGKGGKLLIPIYEIVSSDEQLARLPPSLVNKTVEILPSEMRIYCEGDSIVLELPRVKFKDIDDPEEVLRILSNITSSTPIPVELVPGDEYISFSTSKTTLRGLSNVTVTTSPPTPTETSTNTVSGKKGEQNVNVMEFAIAAILIVAVAGVGFVLLRR